MAFNLNKLGTVGNQSRRASSPSQWTYKNNNGDDVLSVDFFNDASDRFSAGDIVTIIDYDSGVVFSRTTYLVVSVIGGVVSIKESVSTPENILTVAESGGDFASIKDALDSIEDASETNRYVVRVAPGVYNEDNPIQGKSYTSVVSSGGQNTVRVVASNADEHLFLCVNLFFLTGLSLFGVSGTDKYAVVQDTVGEVLIQDCVITDCENGILINNANALTNILTCAIYTINPATTTTVCGICISAGNVILDFLKVVANSKVTTLIDCSGVTSILTLNNIIAFSPNVTTGILADDGCRISGYGSRMIGLYDGIVIQGSNTQVRLDVIQIFNAQNDGFRINNTGTGIELALFATTISGCERFNFNVLNQNSITSGNGFTEIDKSYIVPGAKFYAYLLDTTEDDEGLNILGELHVGIPEKGTEAAIGGGDSYTRGMLVYTETDIGEFTDISVSAKSASGSTFTFTDVTEDSAIYVASSLSDITDVLEHFGIKSKVNTSAVVGTGGIVAEYWNGSAWTELKVMEVESSGSFYPYANNIFEHTGGHHIRYNSDLAIDSWTKNDPMNLETDYYWVRFRINGDIDTAPIFEQFKLHTNRFEINADGWVEYFGNARPIGQLPLNFTVGRPFEGNMQTQKLYVSEDIGVGFTNNKFTATTDKSGIAGNLPYDLDTSSPIKFLISGRPSTTETITWTIRWAWVKDGDTYYTTEPAAIENSDSITTSRAVVAGEISSFIADIDVSRMVSRRPGAFGDQLWLSIQPSTMGGTFSLASSGLNYTKWCEGGHVA